MQDFAAIDFETANAELTSACSVGVVVYRNGVKTGQYYSLIRPEPNYYHFFCSRVNGLTAADTDNAPLFPDVWAQVEPLIQGLPLVAHNKMFDENVLKALFRCYRMDYPGYKFHCTLRKSQRVFPEGRHTLDAVAQRCGYVLTNHHNALADAEACAAIALKIL